MAEKLVRDLSYDAHKRMYILLTPSAPGRDWKMLACKMGYTNEEINYFACSNEHATRRLINDYESRGEKTVSELLSLLEDMKRKDVIEELQNFIAMAPTPTEIANRQKKMDEQEKNKTFLESYDAFVSYAEPDRPFAKEIVRRLEGKPYHMKVCIDYRDFVPGGCYFDAVGTAIEKRCKKVLVVLSENFNESENADFQAKIALSLSPGAKKLILIPILYKACDVPLTLRFITYIDYTRDDTKEFFWDKLAKSLGYIDKNDKTSVKLAIKPIPAKKSGTRKGFRKSKRSTRV